MPSENLDALVDETKALIKEVEGGSPEHAAWVAIQDRVKQLLDGSSTRKVGELLGKHQSWVGDVANWDASARADTPFSNASRPGRALARDAAAAKKVLRDPKTRETMMRSLTPDEVKAIAVEAVKAAPEAAIDAIVHDDDLADDTLNAALDAQIAKDKATSKKRSKKPKTRSALDAWGGVISAAAAGEFQAKKAMESIQSADEAVPDDLRKDASESVDHTIASWELVRAETRGESIGDQIAAEFHAEQ